MDLPARSEYCRPARARRLRARAGRLKRWASHLRWRGLLPAAAIYGGTILLTFGQEVKPLWICYVVAVQFAALLALPPLIWHIDSRAEKADGEALLLEFEHETRYGSPIPD